MMNSYMNIEDDAFEAKAKAEAELARDRETIRHGITPAALEVLKKRYGFYLPIFRSNDVLTAPVPNDVFLRQALIRDGQRQIISFISNCITHD